MKKENYSRKLQVCVQDEPEKIPTMVYFRHASGQFISGTMHIGSEITITYNGSPAPVTFGLVHDNQTTQQTWTVDSIRGTLALDEHDVPYIKDAHVVPYQGDVIRETPQGQIIEEIQAADRHPFTAEKAPIELWLGDTIKSIDSQYEITFTWE